MPLNVLTRSWIMPRILPAIVFTVGPADVLSVPAAIACQLPKSAPLMDAPPTKNRRFIFIQRIFYTFRQLPETCTIRLMHVNLAFGKTGLAADLPPGFDYHVLEARSAQPLANWQSHLDSALDAPLGTP